MDDREDVPKADERRRLVADVIAELAEFRKTLPRLRLEETLSARHEGHKH